MTGADFRPEKIETLHMTLVPVSLPGVLAAWKPMLNGQNLGFIMARTTSDGCQLSHHLLPQARDYLDEIFRAVMDYLYFFQSAASIHTLTPAGDEAVLASLRRVGMIPAETIPLLGESGRTEPHVCLRLARDQWYPLTEPQPFSDVNVIHGEEIDLHCAFVLGADEKKGYVPCYAFDMTLHDSLQAFGGIRLRIGYNESIYYGGNIGYGIQEEFRGHGYAAKACRMLEPLIRRHGMRRVTITCRPDNLPSRKTCEHLGAHLVRIQPLPEHNELYQNGERTECIFHWMVD